MSKWIERSNDTALRFGFNTQDQKVLRETSPTKNPHIQVFTEHMEDQDDTIQDLTRVCPKCEEFNMKYLDKLDRYYCFTCGHREDPETRKRDPKQMDIPFGQRGPYAGYDEQDPTTPFLAPINVNKDIDQYDSNPDVELVRSSQDGRIRHYKCKGLPIEALAAMSEVESGDQ